MNLKFILMIALLVLILAQVVLGGYLAWTLKGDTTNTGAKFFEASKTLQYVHLGLGVGSLLVGGGVFLLQQQR